ncbi:hypothetical protein ACFCP7_17590 [Paenibacillus elgii]
MILILSTRMVVKMRLQPLKAIESIGSKHDGPMSESLSHTDYIMVMDRAYGKLERLDGYKENGQSFVVRLVLTGKIQLVLE